MRRRLLAVRLTWWDWIMGSAWDQSTEQNGKPCVPHILSHQKHDWIDRPLKNALWGRMGQQRRKGWKTAKTMTLSVKERKELLLDPQTFQMRVKPPCPSVGLVPTLFPELRGREGGEVTWQRCTSRGLCVKPPLELGNPLCVGFAHGNP